jgi:cysteine desulfurase
MRDRLVESILSSVEGVTETGIIPGPGDRVPDRSGKVAGSCHLIVDGVEQDELLFLLDTERLYASAGSACASGATEQSHVLNAIGIDAGIDRAALRLSLGYPTTESEIDYAAGVLPKLIEHLRSFS